MNQIEIKLFNNHIYHDAIIDEKFNLYVYIDDGYYKISRAITCEAI